MLNTIEDLVLFICDPINGFDPKKLNPRDRSILYSMASQLKRSLPFTNKQADLVIKIFNDNRALYESIPNFNFLLDFPNYKYPFRVIDVSRKIYYVEQDQTIRVKFPFDQQINKSLEKVNARRHYDSVGRFHYYKISETLILNLVGVLKQHDFEIDPKIMSWYREIEQIAAQPDIYVPSATVENGTVILRNANNNIASYFDTRRKNEIVADAFLAKFMGLRISNALIDEILNQNINNLTKTILSDKTHSRFAITNKGPYDKFSVSDFAKETNAYPLMIFLNDNNDLPIVFKQWIIALNKSGIDNKNISVLFRSDRHGEFNNTVKNDMLNNLVDEDTKVVFVKNKVPKILYKLDFKPRLIISSDTFYVHYTGQKMIDSHPLVLYYIEGLHERMNSKIAKL